MKFASRNPGLGGRAELVAGLALIGFLLGFLGRLWWVFDLCSHFRLQYAGLLVLCLVAFAILRRWKASAVCLLAAIAILATLRPFFTSPNFPVATSERIRIISFNVNTANSRHQEVVDYLKRENADVVFLVEINQAWLNDLKKLESQYPFVLEFARDDNFGVAAFSKRPLEKVTTHEFGPYHLPVLDFEFRMDGKSCRLIGLHTLPPSSAGNSRLRNEQLFKFGAMASASDSDGTVLVGDFNLTPFSPWFAEVLARNGNLRDSTRGFGCQPTWMRFIPCFAIPIDQALVSSSLVVIDRKIGPSCGSDHNALVLTLGLAAPASYRLESSGIPSAVLEISGK